MVGLLGIRRGRRRRYQGSGRSETDTYDVVGGTFLDLDQRHLCKSSLYRPWRSLLMLNLHISSLFPLSSSIWAISTNYFNLRLSMPISPSIHQPIKLSQALHAGTYTCYPRGLPGPVSILPSHSQILMLVLGWPRYPNVICCACWHILNDAKVMYVCVVRCVGIWFGWRDGQCRMNGCPPTVMEAEIAAVNSETSLLRLRQKQTKYLTANELISRSRLLPNER